MMHIFSLDTNRTFIAKPAHSAIHLANLTRLAKIGSIFSR